MGMESYNNGDNGQQQIPLNKYSSHNDDTNGGTESSQQQSSQQQQQQQRQPNYRDSDGARIGGNAHRHRRRKSNLFRSLDSKKFLILAGLIFLMLVVGTYFLVKIYIPNKDYQQYRNGTPITIPNPEVIQGPSGSTLYMFDKAAVCSDSNICSKIGKDILHRGGNVVDAALATLFCNGITTMQSAGIGGGFIMNIYSKSKSVAHTIDAREVAPLAATENMFVDLPDRASLLGPLSIGVPGEMMGYHQAFINYGSMKWNELIEPSIKVCENGFKLSRHMWDAINLNKMIRDDHHLNAMFVNQETGDYHRVGSHIYPPKQLCQTYRLLAKNGALDFYEGELAELIAEDLAEIGSIVTAADLKLYQAEYVHSISVRLNDDIMYVVPPVGSGVIVAHMLNILRGYEFPDGNTGLNNETALALHHMVEAFKFGYAKRYDLGDLRFNRELGSLISNLTSQYYGDYVRTLIDDDKTFNEPDHYGAKYSVNIKNGTSHMSLLGPNGDAVAVTSTINFYFGCGHTGNRTGIVFNGGMADYSTPGKSNFFNIPSSKPNFIVPRKRAMSSMSPTIITDDTGDVKLVIGAAGGGKIPTSIVQVIARVLWFGQDIKQAIDAPRIHHQLIPNTIEYEYGVLQAVIDDLEKRGHITHRYRDRGSTMCGIYRNSTGIYANADYRKEGEVAGI